MNTSHMIDTFALGEQVRKDPKLTIKKKEEVNEHFNSLVARWDRVKDFIALRNERYATPLGGSYHFKPFATFSRINKWVTLSVVLRQCGNKTRKRHS